MINTKKIIADFRALNYQAPQRLSGWHYALEPFFTADMEYFGHARYDFRFERFVELSFITDRLISIQIPMQ